MNNKVIIAIICLLVAVCLAVGIGMNLKGRNSEDETNLISDTKAVSTVDKSSAPSQNTETNTKKEETNSVNTEKKTQASVKEKTSSKATEAKPPVKEKTTVGSTTKKQTTIRTTESNTLSVSFSVNCEKAAVYGEDFPKYLIGYTKCDVKEGTTVFDLLSEQCSKNGIAFVHQNKSYVKSIGGLSEKDCGNASGWIYKVNGEKPMMSASKYVLKDGDTVEWYYVTSPTD